MVFVDRTVRPIEVRDAALLNVFKALDELMLLLVWKLPHPLDQCKLELRRVMRGPRELFDDVDENLLLVGCPTWQGIGHLDP